MPHFFASDLAALAIAFSLGIPIVLIPGYGFGWWFDLFEFRSQPATTRWAWALAFGLTMEPILLYVPFRLISVTGMWIAFAALFLAGMTALTRKNPIPRWSDIPFAAKIATSIALALGCFLMLDVATATGVYPPTQIIDTSFRSQVITSLATTDHLPPRSMFFNPGHPTVLKYHYVFFLISGLMMRLGAGLVTARMALVALALWVELAMLVVVALAIRFFWSFEDNARATRIAWILLLVGGLDILPVGAETVFRWLSGDPHPIPYADINFWNGWGMAFSWIDTLLWAPHNLIGVLGCVMGCIVLWNSRDSNGIRLYASAIAAGFAFASAAGSAIYVTAIFAALLFVVLIEVALNATRYLRSLLVSGIVAFLLALPFLEDMHSSAKQAGGSVFEFAARPFQPVILIFDHFHVRSPLVWNLTYLLTLPLNYLLEFGVFLIAGLWWVYDRRSRSIKLGVREHLAIGLVVLSLILPAIIWSGTEYSNDFGYRGVLPAQFVLLLWAVELFGRERIVKVSKLRTQRRFLQIATAAAILGIGTTFLNGLLIRTAIGNFEKGTVLPGQMLRANYSPSLLADQRNAYVWLQKNSPTDSVVQENPATWQLVALGQYSQRPTVVYGANPSFIMVGKERTEYMRALTDTRRLFEFAVTRANLTTACAEYAVDYLVVQNSDPVWADRHSYVWTQSPVFVSPRVRVLRCPR